MIKWPWHTHRWGPWKRTTATAHGVLGGTYGTLVQVRYCLDSGCQKMKIEKL